MRLTKDHSVPLWLNYHVGTEQTKADHYLLGRRFPLQPASKAYWGVKRLPLPVADLPPTTVREALARRRSTRRFSPSPVDYKVIASMVHAAYGPTHDLAGMKLLAAPSAGARYPVEVYLAFQNIKGAPHGLYHYDHLGQSIELLKEGLLTNDLVEAQVLDNRLIVREAAVVIAMSAVFSRTCEKYGDRGYRFVLLDAGHLCQNLWLAATCLDALCQ